MSSLAKAGWGGAVGVWLTLLWSGWHYRVSIEIWLVLIGLGGAVIGLFVLDRNSFAAKRRTFALRQIAERRGWHFLPDGHPDLLTAFQRFELGSRGSRVHASEARNLLSGVIDGARFYAFDSGFMDGSGKGARYRLQSIVWLQRDDAKLPSFSVYPALFWWTRAGQLESGRRKIDMPGPRWFTAKYEVRGDDEQNVLHMLSADVLPLFNGCEELAVEGSHGNLVACRKAARLLEPDQLVPFLQHCQRLFRSLIDTTSH